MTDDQTDTQSGANTFEESNERFSNFQKEIQRKIDSTNRQTQEQIAALINSQQQLLAQFQVPQQTQDNTDLDDLYYQDPKLYAKEVAERAKKEAVAEVQRTTQAQTQRSSALNKTIVQVTADFPELTNMSSPLTQKVYEYLGDNPQNVDPKDLELAVFKAATALDIQPISKRKKSMSKDDSFTGLSGRGSRPKGGSEDENDEIPEGTQIWAKALGVDLGNKQVKQRVAENSKRRWTDWKGLK